ncbi:hypothetical protein [Sphingomonas humi]|uniref:Uncharacterized protein n=1 Tax=Sphingomonas humi TaxID=335630 RepID=A0ABP7RW15_9SPHN
MTDFASPASPGTAWIDRLSSPARVALLALAVLGCVFAAGVVMGLFAATLERGVLKPLAIAAFVGSLAAGVALGWFAWRLSAHWRGPAQSAYQRRYNRMMAVLVVSGLPLGLLLGVANDGRPQDILSNAPLDPLSAGLAALVSVVVLASTLVLYHRTIDDHEQQAYLWANSLAFYFLVLALPAAWLLARGGLIPPIGIGSAMLILLAACVVNFTVWAWLKYR